MNKKWTAVLMAVVMAIALGACAKDDSGDGGGVASVDGGDTGGSVARAGGDSGMSDEEFEDAMIEFTECMRDQGVDMPDPGTDGGRIAMEPGDMSDAEEDEFAAADAVCRDLLPDMGEAISPEQQAEMEDAMLEFTDCMRDQGIDMPDPDTQGGGISIRVGEGGIDPTDPDFQAAEEECKDILDEAVGAES